MKVLTHPQYSSGYFYLKPEGELAPILHVAEHLFIAGHRVKPHAHDAYEFVYLSRGSATRRAGQTRVKQRMGDLYITYPGEKHAVECQLSEQGRQIQLALHLDRLGAPGTRLARYLRRHHLRVLRNCEMVEPILQAIIEQVATNRPHRHEVISSYLASLCAVIEQAAIQAVAPGSTKTRTALPFSQPVQKALTLMKARVERRLPLREMAAAAAIPNVSQFCTQFRRELEVTPSAYHLQLRLDAARRALLRPTTDITEVAMDHGFSSSQHFCATFRRAFGISPGAWMDSVRPERKRSESVRRL